MIIAIDGPAAAGKGTLARRIAAELGFAYLDTGSLYRATAKKVLDQAIDPDDDQACTVVALNLTPADLDVDGLRTEDVGQAASKVSAIPGVRSALLRFQRDVAANPPDGKAGAVLDGRDIGTVVCPEADVKFFVTASTEVRAERRFKELREAGEDAIYARVLEEMRERDERDTNRAVAPLKPAEDATVIDTSGLDADQVFEQARDIVAAKQA
ncbi:MAG: (d)CMP kinase [Rhodospirillales bacterium]|nr:(d)CMP kinase [Rhodospirillales bacterium]MBO6787875.1 (d)CMP kinase [Rhodospirillales bacterium]